MLAVRALLSGEAPGRIVDVSQPSAGGLNGLVYQAVLPVSTQTVTMVAGLIRDRRKAVGSRWRKAGPGTQAMLVLVVPRHDQRLVDLAVEVFAGTRCAVERGFAAIKTWRVLDRLRMNPRHATTLTRAILVLVQHEQRTRRATP